MFKSLDMDGYLELSDEGRQAIDEWTEKYGLGTATLVTQVQPDGHNFWGVLEVWGVLTFPRFHAEGEMTETIWVTDDSYELTKLAEFDFDDFPWDLIPE